MSQKPCTAIPMIAVTTRAIPGPLTICAASTDVLTGQPSAQRIAFALCNLARVIDADAIEALRISVTAAMQPLSLEERRRFVTHLSDVMQVLPERAAILDRMSIALIAGQFDTTVKDAWAIAQFRHDRFALAALQRRLEKPDERLLLALLDNDGYPLIAEELDIPALLSDENLARGARLNLLSYYALANDLSGSELLGRYRL